MNIKHILGCPSTKDKNHKPQKGEMVAKCDKCSGMLWIVPPIVKAKQEKGFDLWCSECILKLKNDDPDAGVLFLDIEDIDKAPNSAEGLQEAMLAIEERLFDRAQAGHDQAMAGMEEALPSLLRCVMGQLRIFEKIEHLAIAVMIESQVMGILLRRRESIGPGECFSCWDEEQTKFIITFIMSVGKAVHDLCGQMDENGWDSIFKDVDSWHDGFDHWKEGFFGEGDWGGGGGFSGDWDTGSGWKD